MKSLIIRELDKFGADIITGIPDDKPTNEVVEAYQRASYAFKLRRTLPAVIWTTSDADNLVDLMIESARI